MLRARDVDNGRSMKTKTCAEAPVTFHRGLREYGYHHEIRAECAGCGATFWAGAEEDALRMVQDHLNPPAVKCKVRWIDDATGKPTPTTPTTRSGGRSAKVTGTRSAANTRSRSTLSALSGGRSSHSARSGIPGYGRYSCRRFLPTQVQPRR